MRVTELEAKSLLRIGKKTDPLFVSRYHMNLYRGCGHNCVYCDGRAEKYNVPGEFGTDVAVKTNTIDLLRGELDPSRRRKPLPRGFVCLGGGVGDSWQPVDRQWHLAREVLVVLKEQNYPVHVLTKATLMERDLDLLTEINQQNRALVSMSFSSVDQELSRILEPGVPSPRERLQLLAESKKRGLACGMFLMPVIPFLTDSKERISETVAAAAAIGLDWIIFGGMTLKTGRQADCFYDRLGPHWPELVPRWHALYDTGNEYGGAPRAYYGKIERCFFEACRKSKMPMRIPRRFFADQISREDLVLVLLEHIDYLSLLAGRKTGFGYAAWCLGQSRLPLGELLQQAAVPGVSVPALRTAREIHATATAAEYERLMSLAG